MWDGRDVPLDDDAVCLVSSSSIGRVPLEG
jgi:hypothetical protein